MIDEELKNTKFFERYCLMLDEDKLSHAIMVVCKDGETARRMTTLMVLKLLCDDVCGECSSCVKVLSGTHPDVLVFPEKDNFLVSDASRIQEETNVKPLLGEKKVFILNNFSRSTPQAQNKLLKTLEEPPKNVYFFIWTTDLNSILPTIKSRTQILELERLSDSAIESFLKRECGEASPLAVKSAEGYLGKALSFQKDESFMADYKLAVSIIRDMKTSKDVLSYASKFSEKLNFENRINILENCFDELLFVNMGDVEGSALEGLEAEYNQFTVAKIFERINLAKKQFKANCNLGLIADSLLLGILEEKYLCK